MENSNIRGFTCGDLLLIPDFQEAVVLAGANGLNRLITRVNVMEVPDVIDWVRPGEFLITSGFPFRDNPGAIAELIPQLDAKGVSALGIKRQRFIDRIPHEALKAADRLDFPIIELPVSTVFSDVVRDIMERVLVQEARELSLLQSRFQKLSQQLLHGKGIEEFLQTLDEMLNNPVILLDGDDHLFFSPQAAQVSARMENPADWLRMRSGTHPGVRFVSVGERRIRVHVSTVNDRYDCLLMLLEWNREFSVLDQLTIERVGVLVGLEMMNANARKEVEAKYVDQFLQDWLSGRIATMEDLRIRAEACGCLLEEGHGYCAGLVRWIDGKPAMRQLQQAVKRIRSRSADPRIYATLWEGTIALLVRLPPNGSVRCIAEAVVSQLRAVFPDDATFSVCLGNRVEQAGQVHASCAQAKKIRDISQICGVRDAWIDAAKLGVFQVLHLLPDSEEVRQFRDRYILPLIEYDNKHGTNLLETVRTYFRNNRNAKKTSQEMYAHYNTITYRVERAFGLLGIRADSGDEVLQLELAVKLHEMRPPERPE
jgi:purine catabolism regulator